MAKSGQGEAFGLLYEEYVERVYRYVYVRTGRVEEAEDLTQEVFLRALNSIDAYRDHGKPFSAWLMRIAHNLLIDHYRQADRRRFVPLWEHMASGHDDPAASVESRMEMTKVLRAVTDLPPRQKEVISLRFGAGLSIIETAMAMGKTEGAVKTLQHEAVVRLRKMMGTTRKSEARIPKHETNPNDPSTNDQNDRCRG